MPDDDPDFVGEVGEMIQYSATVPKKPSDEYMAALARDVLAAAAVRDYSDSVARNLLGIVTAWMDEQDQVSLLPSSFGRNQSAAVTGWIRENYRGERVSIRIRTCRKQIADQVKSEFDGTNLAEVMERHGISRSTVYRIIGDS